MRRERKYIVHGSVAPTGKGHTTSGCDILSNHVHTLATFSYAYAQLREYVHLASRRRGLSTPAPFTMCVSEVA